MSLFKKRIKNTIVAPEIPKPVELTEEEKATAEKERLNHFYGCDEDGNPEPYFAMMDIRSIGWNIKPSKTYTLTGIEDYKEKVSIWGLISAWRGTGKSEWEFMMAYLVVASLRQAWKKGEQEIDITSLFDRDLLAQNMEFTQEQIAKHVMKVFTVVSESTKEVVLKLNVC